jgi:hypothetical protein
VISIIGSHPRINFKCYHRACRDIWDDLGKTILGIRIGAFEFEVGNLGVRVVVGGKPISAACETEGEIDAAIARLKNDLDAVALHMKAAVKAQE